MTSKTFKPSWWLRNRHLQSCYGTLVGVKTRIALRWEQLELPDGDFVDICWAGESQAPIVILLHGLEGSVYSHYMQAMIDTLIQHQWQTVVLNYRTCSGRLNRLPRSYNGGDIDDLAYLVQVVHQRHPQLPLGAVGFSLGGNILIRYLALTPQAPLCAAASISVPYDLAQAADYCTPFYQRNLLRSMKRKAIAKIRAGQHLPATIDEIKLISDLREFDDLLTAPLFGYGSVDQYYAGVGCRSILHKIQHPTLIMHALDDPFIPPHTVPTARDVSSSTRLEITEKGGHVGFIQGGLPWRPQYWFKQRISQFLQEFLSNTPV